MRVFLHFISVRCFWVVKKRYCPCYLLISQRKVCSIGKMFVLIHFKIYANIWRERQMSTIQNYRKKKRIKWQILTHRVSYAIDSKQTKSLKFNTLDWSCSWIVQHLTTVMWLLKKCRYLNCNVRTVKRHKLTHKMNVLFMNTVTRRLILACKIK